MKRKIFALGALALIPAFTLCGCGSKGTFSFTASCDESLGYCSTGSTKAEFEEGQTVNFSATAFNASNPFLCWVKDYKEIASKEADFQLTSNAQNQGQYVAVFQCPTPNQMRFFAPLRLTYNGSDVYTNFSYTFSYSDPAVDANTFTPFLTSTQGQPDATIFDKSVLYFDELTQSRFYIRIEIDTSTPDGGIIQNFSDGQIEIDNQSFAGNSTCSFQIFNDEFTIEFAKLTSELF